MAKDEAVVILGGGIIGLSIAYYLSELLQYKHRIHVVDAAEKLFESASGYAGGFLARDWHNERAAALGDLSFKLHRQLADDHNGQERWGYAGSHVYSLTLDDAPAGTRGEDWLLAGTSRAQSAGRRAVGHVSGAGESTNADGTPAWITPQQGASWSAIAGIEDCAQVEPRKLCQFLLEESQKRGVNIHLGMKATEVIKDPSNKTSALKLQATTGVSQTHLSCGEIIVAAGCWTPQVFNTLFPRSRLNIEIDALAGHSVIYRTPRYSKPFANIVHGQGNHAFSKDKHISYAIYCPPTKSWSFSAEAYARLDGSGKPEIWIGGLNHTNAQLPLPDLPTDSKKLMIPHERANLRNCAVQLTGLKKTGDKSSQPEDDLEIVSEALCFRPVSKTGVPIIQQVPQRVLGLGSSESGSGARVWIASGHGPWGISLSLGTGLVMRDMIVGRKPTVDVSELRLELPIASKL
jgi:glycine/D-amino acid oxidase-like deaminating enzyme